jgi:hypothetical protein
LQLLLLRWRCGRPRLRWRRLVRLLLPLLGLLLRLLGAAGGRLRVDPGGDGRVRRSSL